VEEIMADIYRMPGDKSLIEAITYFAEHYFENPRKIETLNVQKQVFTLVDGVALYQARWEPGDNTTNPTSKWIIRRYP
jgi:hypothetical protein